MELSNIGSPELLWVIIIGLVLFGANRIPQVMRGLGEGMKEFKKATREMAEDEKPTPPAATEARDAKTGTGANN